MECFQSIVKFVVQSTAGVSPNTRKQVRIFTLPGPLCVLMGFIIAFKSLK